MKRALYAVLAFLTLATTSCRSGPPAPSVPLGGVLMRFGDHAVGAEVANTEAERELGLMHRRLLRRDAGMLFVFPKRQRKAFWMKNTLIPLSIAYLVRSDENTYRVESILDMAPCRADPCENYPSRGPVDAALEANQGWFKRAGVSRGDEVKLEGTPPQAL